MITAMWRSKDGLTIVWEVNPGMLYAWDVATGFDVPVSEDFRAEMLDPARGQYERVYG